MDLMLRELAIICITPPLESKPLMMTSLRAIDTRKYAVLDTNTSTQCAITDSIKSTPEIVVLRVKVQRRAASVTRGENWL